MWPCITPTASFALLQDRDLALKSAGTDGSLEGVQLNAANGSGGRWVSGLLRVLPVAVAISWFCDTISRVNMNG